MNQKKSKKIIVILIVVAVIIILLSGLTLMYLATDIFRSDKELFFKYITQMADSEKGFINNELKQYYDKRNNTPYEDEGSFSVNIKTQNGQNQFDNVNNFNITFTGNVDTPNSKSEQNISLNYSDKVKFPFSYRQIENSIGLQTKYVGSKYVAIQTDKIHELENNSNINTNSITKSSEKLQEISSIELSEEDKKHIQEIYTKFLNEQLQNNSFTKVQEGDAKGYKLTLNGEEIKNLLKSFLETLKNDQLTLDKLNQYIKAQKNSSKITQNDIDDMIKDIDNNSEINNQKLEIIVYVKDKNVSKLQIIINEAKLQLEKIQTGNDLQYGVSIDINIDNETANLYFNAKYSGLQSMQSISENYELGISESNNIQYKYNFNNNINFVQNVNIEELSNSNAMILNNYDKEKINNFMNAVIERINQVNKLQMEQLGLEENENPIQYIIPNLSIYNNALNIINNQESLSEVEISTYNEKFEMYEGTNEAGVTVKGLFTVIKSNNENEDRLPIEEINFNGEEYEATEQNITLLKGEISTEDKYRVEFERDQDTGRIYRVVINKK